MRLTVLHMLQRLECTENNTEMNDEHGYRIKKRKEKKKERLGDSACGEKKQDD